MWEDFSKNLLECGKQVPGNLRREFEQVSKYNEKRKKKKEKEKNNYVEDFEEPEDRVLKDIAETDVANHNNLMLSGNSSTDYDAMQEVRIRWD